MSAKSQEYKRTAWIVALIFFLIMLLILLLVKLAPGNPPFPMQTLEMIEMDFSGGGSSSGSPANESQQEVSNSKVEQPEDPVETHDTESPVEHTNRPKTDGNSSTDNNNETTNTEDPKNDLNGVFGNGGNNNGTDNNDDGGNGGGNGGFTGTGNGPMDGTRKALNKPTVTDSYSETGIVVVKIYIKKDGTVDKNRTKVVDENPGSGKRTTCTSKKNLDIAERTANKFKFEKDASAKNLEYTYVDIRFKMQ